MGDYGGIGSEFKVKISRVWAMPSKWTFDVLPVRKVIETYCSNGRNWADPFSGKNIVTQYHNNLGESGIDAYDFMDTFKDNSLDGVLFDPPYSMEQVKRSYAGVGISDWQTKYGDNRNGGFPHVKDMIKTKLKQDGMVISFGWNSNGMGVKRGFEKIEILLIAHGGNRNDTIVVVERKV